MIKKYSIFLVLLFLVIISSGCNREENKTKTETTKNTETTEDIPVNPKEKDIVAEKISDDSDLRKALREFMQKTAFIVSVMKKEKETKKKKEVIDNADRF